MSPACFTYPFRTYALLSKSPDFRQLNDSIPFHVSSMVIDPDLWNIHSVIRLYLFHPQIAVSPRLDSFKSYASPSIYRILRLFRLSGAFNLTQPTYLIQQFKVILIFHHQISTFGIIFCPNITVWLTLNCKQ